MTGLRLWDTRRRAKVAFEPGDPKRVTMYVCGPTVYGRAHIGNARPAVVFDVLFRLLRHIYGADNVVYARNITDIDDKIIAAAAKEGRAPHEIAAEFERLYDEDMAALGCLLPTITPRATEHVPQMIAMAERLIAAEVAYVAEGHVLFSVAADPGYGSLSGRDRAAMVAGARVEVAPYKRDPADFVLWKPSSAEQPGWDSPWGRGRPGWHIECSAMIAEHLGETIDIHAGGQDLIFPHHENEAAQSRAANGAELARVWMHNGFLGMGADKMSKSLGNVVTVGELLEQGWDGDIVRLALLSTHYRQPLTWTETTLSQAQATRDGYRNALRLTTDDPYIDRNMVGSQPFKLFDDLNTPAMLGEAQDYRRILTMSKLSTDRSISKSKLDVIGNILGLGAMMEPVTLRFSPGVFRLPGVGHPLSEIIVQAAVTGRLAARRARDFATADQIRDELLAEGIVLEDRADGTTDWRRA